MAWLTEIRNKEKMTNKKIFLGVFCLDFYGLTKCLNAFLVIYILAIFWIMNLPEEFIGSYFNINNYKI